MRLLILFLLILILPMMAFGAGKPTGAVGISWDEESGDPGAALMTGWTVTDTSTFIGVRMLYSKVNFGTSTLDNVGLNFSLNFDVYQSESERYTVAYFVRPNGQGQYENDDGKFSGGIGFEVGADVDLKDRLNLGIVSFDNIEPFVGYMHFWTDNAGFFNYPLLTFGIAFGGFKLGP